MNTLMASIGSKKLLFAGALAGIIAQDGASSAGGMAWFHVIGLAIIGAGYCVAAALQEGLEGQGYDAQELRESPPKS